MSIDLITMVRRRLDVSHGELLVAVELADAANDDGEGISVGVQRIADRSRQDERTVQRQLKRLREVGWLEIVEQGGMVGGRGRATRYRINPAWVRGDILPGFPDFEPKYYRKEKGDDLSPLASEQPGDKSGGGVTNSAERVTKPGVKGDTQVSPDPYTHIPSGAPAGASDPCGLAPGAPEPKKPAGNVPRATGKAPPEPASFDPVLSRGVWFQVVHNAIVSGAVADGVSKYGAVRMADLPLNARVTLEPVLVELTDWAVAEERSGWPNFTARSRKGVEDEIEARVRRELRVLRPPTASERAAAEAAA
jgi:hypothetical protein